MLPKIKRKPKTRKIFFPELPTVKSLSNNKNTQTVDNFRKMDCCICLQEITTFDQPNVSITKCHHSFCTSCLIKTMKYGNTCPLCRTILRSPTKKMNMTHTVSSSIIQQELLFYDDYIKESFNYIIDMIHYYITEKKLTQGVMDEIHKEMKKVFQNFGMGICYNINRSLEEMYRTQYQGEQTQAAEESQVGNSNIGIYLEEELVQLSDSDSIRSMSAPNVSSPLETLLQNDGNSRRNSSPFGLPPI